MPSRMEDRHLSNSHVLLQKLSTRGTTTDCLKSVRQDTGVAFGQTLYFDGTVGLIPGWLFSKACYSYVPDKGSLRCVAFAASVASICEAEALGVTGVRLRSGLSCAALESGLRAFEQRGLDSRGF